MPALTNAKHEKFCQALITGLSQGKAYVKAGYKINYGNASKLVKTPKVAARLIELNREAERLAIRDAAISKAWVLECLRDNALKGLSEEKASSVATRCLELIGRELGMFIERQESGKPGDFAHLSDEELDAQLTQRLKARGLSDKQVRNFLAVGSSPVHYDEKGGSA